MKRSLVALSLAGTALLSPVLTACSDNQSGNANPDSQVVQPPTPGDDPASGGRSQGPAGSPTP